MNLALTSIYPQPEPVPENLRIGDVVRLSRHCRHADNENFILGQVTPNVVIAVSLKDGNRMKDPVHVADVRSLTADEVNRILVGSHPIEDWVLVRRAVSV